MANITIYREGNYVIVDSVYHVPGFRISSDSGFVEIESLNKSINTINQGNYRFKITELRTEAGVSFTSAAGAIEYLKPVLNFPIAESSNPYTAGAGQLETSYQLSSLTALNEINETLKEMLFYIKGISE